MAKLYYLASPGFGTNQFSCHRKVNERVKTNKNRPFQICEFLHGVEDRAGVREQTPKGRFHWTHLLVEDKSCQLICLEFPDRL